MVGIRREKEGLAKTSKRSTKLEENRDTYSRRDRGKKTEEQTSHQCELNRLLPSEWLVPKTTLLLPSSSLLLLIRL